MAFVTDCIWRSPLGLKINAQDTAGVAQTEDCEDTRRPVSAPQRRLRRAHHGGARETHFFDHVSLLAVDHPAGTDILWMMACFQPCC